jgi:hypothetical protein
MRQPALRIRCGKSRLLFASSQGCGESLHGEGRFKMNHRMLPAVVLVVVALMAGCVWRAADAQIGREQGRGRREA